MATAQSRKTGRRPAGARLGRISKTYDRKLEAILRKSAAVFCARGYHQASMRDIARATGASLAGLYYYFASKEELLYLIQRHTFDTILAAAQQKIETIASPEVRLRALVQLHVQFFLDHPNEMKVLTHEQAWLGQEHGSEVRAIKRAYYQLCLAQVEFLKKTHHLHAINTRLAVLSLFGMMNWIYTWYNPRIDPDAATCAEIMVGIFLEGIFGNREAWTDGQRKALVRKLTKLDGRGNGRSQLSNGTGNVKLPALARSNPRISRAHN